MDGEGSAGLCAASVPADVDPLREEASPAPEGTAGVLSLTVLERLAETAGPLFQCPGEPQPISRAVHLSRMANFYAKCRTCPQAIAGGVSPPTVLHTPASQIEQQASTDVWTRDGIRGTYLTVLGRPQAEALAVAFAATLWQKFARRGRGEDDLPAGPGTSPPAPTILVSRNGTAPAPDIACGVVRGLRRMGCHVVELGSTTRPTLDFAVYHLRAEGGVHVTGAGGGPAAAGMDLVDRDGVPWSRPGQLDQMRACHDSPPGRPTRRGGELRSFDIEPPARAEFQRQGQGLRRLRIGVAAECPVQRVQLASWCSAWPSSLVPIPALPNLVREVDENRELRRHLRGLMQELELQWLVQIAEDGRQVELLDERCRPVDPAAWLIRLAEQEAAGAAERRFVVGADVPPMARGRLQALGAEVVTVDASHEALVRGLMQSSACLAADGRGRVWLADHYPLCDGLVTVARLARLACRSGQPVSHWAT